MSRELYGALIGVATFMALLTPLPVFVLLVSLLAILIAKELCKSLSLEDLYPSAAFSPLLFYISPALGGLYISLISLLYGYRNWSLELFFRSLFVLFYTGFFLSYILLVKEESTYLLIVLVFGVWANDVFAYYVGKNFGRRPLFPKLSPNKTLEGFLGGIAAGTIIFLFLLGRPPLESFLVGVLTFASGVAGDYFKSFIKRQLGIKDFSNVLGQHGGFTDRFDALMFAAPVFYWLLFRI